MSVLSTRAQLEECFGKPQALVMAKTITHLDPGALSWIGASAIMIASLAYEDDIDVVIGGGSPGWASGDRQYLSLPADGLDAPERFVPGAGFGSIFLVPSLNELLRVNGRVASNDGAEIRVAVEECYIHCGKALIRSGFWSATPSEAANDDIGTLAKHCSFIGLATSDAGSHADLSPKGDPAGLMVRMDGDTLSFADRPGNKRIDSFRNIIDRPRIAAAMLCPGTDQVAIVKGAAQITDDVAARDRFAVDDKVPELVTQMRDITVDRRTSKALARASLWPAPAAPEGLSGGKIAAGHLKLGKGLAGKLAGAVMSMPGLVERELAKDYKNNLY